MQQNLFFQYCQKLVILSADKKSVLLAKRKGEADYDGVYSFIGGKMETTDQSFIASMEREKNEEIGTAAKVGVLSHETYNVLFQKKDGAHVVLPHVASLFRSGKIVLSDEYSEFKWVPLNKLQGFEPKIENIPELAQWASAKLQSTPDDLLVEI